jgi:DDE superfamily endonuclease
VFTQTNRQVYISDLDNRELLTFIESISAISKTSDPIVIMLSQQMKEKHFPKGLNDGIQIAVSESGYTNDVLSFEWLKHFDTQTRPPNNEWRMLVMDGYGLHLTIEFVDYCYKPNVKISVFLLLAHSTHLLQPLDIRVFQSFKHYY